MLREESIVLVIAPHGEEDGISLHLDPPAAVPREPETWAHGRGFQVVMGRAVQGGIFWGYL